MSYAIDPDQYRREQDEDGPRHPDSCENWPVCRHMAPRGQAYCRDCQESRDEWSQRQYRRAVQRFFKESA